MKQLQVESRTEHTQGKQAKRFNGRRFRSIAFAVLLSVVLAAMSACAGSQQPQEGAISGEAQQSNGNAAESTATQPRAKLTYAGSESPYAPVSYVDVLPVWEEIAEITNTDVEFQVVPGAQYWTTMQVRLAAAKDIPDVFDVRSDVFRYSKEGLLLELTDLIAEHAPHIQALFEQYPDIVKEIRMPSGELYTVAAYFIGNADISVFVPLIREDWLEQLNLEVPRTVDDFYNVLKAFKAEYPESLPLSMHNSFNYGSLAAAFGLHDRESQYWWAGDDRKVVYEVLSPKYKEYVTYLNKLYAEGLLDPLVYQPDLGALNNIVSNNQLGAGTGYDNLVPLWNALLTSSGVEDGRFVPIPPFAPVHDDDDIFIQKLAAVGNQYAISSKSSDPVATIKWLDFLLSEQGSNIVNFGVEGISYEMADGRPQLTDFVLNNPDGLDPGSALRSLGAWGPMPRVATHDFVRQLNTVEANAFVDQVSEYLVAPFPKMVASDEEQARLSQLMPDITTYVTEMSMKFVTGGEPLDNFDAFVGNLRSMGIEEVIAIKQTQYDRYAAD